MAGFIIEFRDEDHYEDVVGKMHKAKKAVCEAFDALEAADSGLGERGSYRSGMYRGGSYRDERSYRDDYDYDMRRGGRYRY